jgi:hypothetical protein
VSWSTAAAELLGADVGVGVVGFVGADVEADVGV